MQLKRVWSTLPCQHNTRGAHECNTATSVMVGMWGGSRGGQFLKDAKTLFNRKGNTSTVSSLKKKKKKKAQNLVLHKALLQGWSLPSSLHDPSQTLLDFYIWKYVNRGTCQSQNHLNLPPLVPLSNRFLTISDDVRSQKTNKKNTPLNSYNEQSLSLYRWDSSG